MSYYNDDGDGPTRRVALAERFMANFSSDTLEAATRFANQGFSETEEDIVAKAAALYADVAVAMADALIERLGK